MPNRTWYDVPLRSKLSARDGRRHVAIPADSIRVASITPNGASSLPLKECLFDRDDYLRVAEQLLRRGVVLHLYGAFQDLTVETTYRALADRSQGELVFAGGVERPDFATELSQYDAALLSGFVPYQPVPRSADMHVPPAFDAVLAARLPLLAAAGTWAWGERAIQASGIGAVFESIDRLVDTLHDDGALARASNAAHAAQDVYCDEASRRGNHCSSVAA